MSPSVRAAIAYVTLFSAVGAYFPYLPVFYRSRGVEVGAIGILAAMAAVIGMVSSPFWGSLADRRATARIALVAAAAVAATGAALLSIGNDLLFFGVAAAITAICGSGVAPILDARALDTVAADRNRYGRLRAWGSLSFIGASVAVGALIERTEIRALFLVYVPAMLATAFIGSTLRPAHVVQATTFLAGARSVLRHPVLARFLVVALAAWSSLFAFTAFFSLYLADLGVPAGTIGLAWALGAAVEIPIMFSFPTLAARFGVERLLAVGALMFAVRAIGCALTTDPVLLVGLTAFAGSGFALMIVGGVTYVSQHAPQGLAATAQGVLVSVTFGLAMTIGSSVGGIVASAVTVRGLFFVCAAASFVSAVAVMIVMRRARHAAQRQTPIVA